MQIPENWVLEGRLREGKREKKEREKNEHDVQQRLNMMAEKRHFFRAIDYLLIIYFMSVMQSVLSPQICHTYKYTNDECLGENLRKGLGVHARLNVKKTEAMQRLEWEM